MCLLPKIVVSHSFRPELVKEKESNMATTLFFLHDSYNDENTLSARRLRINHTRMIPIDDTYVFRAPLYVHKRNRITIAACY